MLKGKKGFDRILWAAKNVLNQSLAWLVVDLAEGSKGMFICLIRLANHLSLETKWCSSTDQLFSDDIQESLSKHQPTIVPVNPSSTLLQNVLVPSSLTTPPDLSTPRTAAKSTLPSEEAQESLYDLFEYLDLLSLRSPRVLQNHRVDPFISRYSVPDGTESAHVSHVRVLSWTGLISARWALQLFCHFMYVPIVGFLF